MIYKRINFLINCLKRKLYFNDSVQSNFTPSTREFKISYSARNKVDDILKNVSHEYLKTLHRLYQKDKLKVNLSLKSAASNH